MALDAQRNWDASMANNLHSMMARSKRNNARKVVPEALDSGIQLGASTTHWTGQPAPHLPAEVVIQIMSNVRNQLGIGLVQNRLHACSLVSHDWNAAATPFLYSHPVLCGPNYDLFTRTICPSINISVRKSPLSSFVKQLDLSLLIHHGSKSVTARLLGRTKNSLEIFVAPQASFSLNCFPALSKCHSLTYLDLSLVSEATPLRQLFDTVAHLSKLKRLNLPRSAGFGASIDPASISWPPNLENLVLSGGLDISFWYGSFAFPSSLTDICVTHCPRLDHAALHAFLGTLRKLELPRLTHLGFANLPHLNSDSLITVLLYRPHLKSLSVSVDYVTADLLNPWGVEWSADHSFEEPGKDRFLALEHLHLTNSGDIDDPEKFMPIDVLIVGQDLGTIPKLTVIRVEKSLGWFSEDEEQNLEALEDWLTENAKGLDIQDKHFYGVKQA